LGAIGDESTKTIGMGIVELVGLDFEAVGKDLGFDLNEGVGQNTVVLHP